jgi:translocation and assembly module TamA
VPVRVELAANPRNTWRVGVGYGTDTGPRLAADWDNRYLNARGHGAEARLRLSPVLSTLSGSYLIPFFRGKDVELGVTTLLTREDTDTSESNSVQTGVKRLTSRWGWNETLSLSYRYEDFRVGAEKDTSNLLMPGIGYWKSVSDDPVYPRKGWRLSMDLRTAVEGFVSDTTFLQGLLRAKYILPVADVGRFIARADFGGTLVSDVRELPASLRFFAGGDNSVRGFDYESLGPENADGDVTGGRYLAVGSVEYEHQVKGNWSVAVFSDVGNAFDELSDDFEYSVGTGVRWRSPVGLVRVDIAAGISDADLPIRLHFVIGPDL